MGGVVMKLIKWVQFTWDLGKIPAGAGDLPGHYRISPATADDGMALRKVFSSSFLLDPAWNPAISEVMRTIQLRLDAALPSETQSCLALRHGQRIIGAALLHPDSAAAEHLVIGPSILAEYRNRGFGTLLLRASLIWLREAGLNRAAAMAPDYVPVTKFLYPKFGGILAPVQPTVLLAA
ncbi:MAG TPA: GNAT family N-acetyltransferase [Chthoniobacterales bacterium]|jgi:GNAT superfamily N-acetyltransferase